MRISLYYDQKRPPLATLLCAHLLADDYAAVAAPGADAVAVEVNGVRVKGDRSNRLKCLESLPDIGLVSDFETSFNLVGYFSDSSQGRELVRVQCSQNLQEWLVFCVDRVLFGGTGSSFEQINSTLSSHLKFRTFLDDHFLSLCDVVVFASLLRRFGFKKLLKKSSVSAEVGRWLSYLFSVSPFRPESDQYPGVRPVVEASKAAFEVYAEGDPNLLTPAPPKADQKGAANTTLESGQDGSPRNSGVKKGERKEKGKDGVNSGSAFEHRLPDAEKGKVVTRFPPEPSGYLHIGHAKAALLNAFYARVYEGKLLIRFDDTNPAREKLQFEESILEDLKLLDIQTKGYTHTSDYFDLLEEYCLKLIKNGTFYVDDTPLLQMRFERGEGIESKNRNRSIDENLILWEEMKKGSARGQECCVRARIDMQAKKKCLRDPVMYRCVVDIPHLRHGFKYKVYPMYDFACPIVDSIEGVTHAMRSNEYSERIEQYEWVIKACDLRPVTIYEFSRLNMVNTVLSKRKLQQLVDTQVVEGWDDPRFPTVRGIRRRGLQVEALMNFILEQGPSKNVNLMEWDKLWAKNKQVIDPVAPRFMAVDKNSSKKVKIINFGDHHKEDQDMNGGVYVMRELHPKNPAVGQAKLLLGSEILIDEEDALQLQTDGEEITLMRWCNAIVELGEDQGREKETKVLSMRLNPSGDFKTTKKRLHWVEVKSGFEAVLREYDLLITKRKPEEDDELKNIINKDSVFDTEVILDAAAKDLKMNDIVQFERRGYFRLDKFDQQKRPIYIRIPDGKSKAVSIVKSKIESSRLAKGGDLNI